MSYENKAFWKRTVAFVLTVLMVITSMPFSMQRVNASDTHEFIFTLVYNETTISEGDSVETIEKPVVEKDVKFIITSNNQENYTYSATGSDEGKYTISVADNSDIVSAGNLVCKSLIIDANGYKKCVVTDDNNKSGRITLEPKKDGVTAAFESSDKTITYADTKEGEYDVSSLLKITTSSEDAADTTALAGESVKYSISGGNNNASIDENGIITGLTATASDKNYVVTAVVSFDDYKDTTATMNLEVKKADQSDAKFAVEKSGVTFDNTTGTHVYTNALSGVKENAVVTYALDSSSDSSVATVDSTSGKVTYNKAGSVKVNATIKETTNYNEKVVSYTLIIGKQSVNTFKFGNNSVDVTYGDNNNKYTQKVTAEKNIGTITYKVTDNSDNVTDVASIDAATGELTVLKAGTVKITAEAAGTDTYGSASTSYTLVIKKAEREITFDNKDTEITIDYNDSQSYINAAKVTAGDGNIQYSIVSGNGKVDENGKVSYSTDGNIVVKAYAADDCYNECSKEYTLTVNYAEAESYDKYVSIQGNKTNNWYTGEVTIKASEGYSIREKDNDVWQSALVKESDGEYNPVIYVKRNSDEVIYRQVAIPAFKIDRTAPEYAGITYSESVKDRVINAITFGFYKKTVDVTVSAKDGGSGIESITYNVIENPGTAAEKIIKNETIQSSKLVFNGETASYTSTITTNGKYRVTFTATDAAGNTSGELNDANRVVIDDISPVIEYSYDEGYKDKVSSDNASVESGDDIRYIYDKDVTGTVKVSDEYLDNDTIEINIIKDGEAYKTVSSDELKKQEAITTYDFNLSEEGSYVITTEAEDYSGNPMQSIWKCVIDKTAPVVDITYNNQLKDGYVKERTATITITEKNLRTSDITAYVNATDSLGREADVNVKLTDNNGQTTTVKLSQLSETLKDSKYWTHTGDEWKSAITFSEDAEYNKVKIECTDLAKHVAIKDDTAKFIIDNTIPEAAITTPDTDNLINGTYYYGKDVSAMVEISVTDEHFNKELINIVDEYTGAAATGSESIECKNLTWENKLEDGQRTNIWTTSINLSDKEGRHVIKVSGCDSNQNALEDKSLNVIVDHTNPVITVKYDDNNGGSNEVNGVTYYKNNIKATITIKEANFDASKVETTVSAKDVKGNDIALDRDYAAYLKDSKNWTDKGNGEYAAEIIYDKDANYTFNIKCTDLVNLESAQRNDDKFTVDTVKPSDYDIKYSEPVVKKVLETLTFNIVRWFYQDECTVTLTSKDETSGIDSLTYNVTDTDTAEIIKTETIVFDKKEETASHVFTVKNKGEFNITFTSTDVAGNTSGEFSDVNRIVVDDKSPEIEYSYDEGYKDKVLSDNTSVESGDDIRYIYDKDVTGSVKVSDEYLDNDTIKINIAKDGEAYKTVSSNDLTKQDSITTYDFELSEEGSYVITTEVKDYSGNPMQSTWKCVIDKTAPVVDIAYKDDSRYEEYVKERTATITITEKNLRTSDITAYVNATDSLGREADVNVKLEDNNGQTTSVKLSQLSETLKESKYWIHTGDEWKSAITFSEDAEYNEVKIECTDLAKHVGTKHDTTKFIIDNTKPEAAITTPDTDNLINGTYYYGKDVSAMVEISVTDEHFNKELINVVDEYTGAAATGSESIECKNLTWENKRTEDGQLTYTWIASIDLSDKEGRHVIKVSGCDNNQNALEDKSLNVIVDHTNPVITVKYDDNNGGSNEVNGVTYYKNNIKAIITIKEANFDASKVETTVSAKDVKGNDIALDRDYAAYLKDSKNWTDKGNGEYAAEIIYDKDANYTFNIKCTDLVNLESAQQDDDKFTVDTVKPYDYVIEYSKPVVKRILDTITFRLFYYDKSTVTITAKDDIAGIQKFVYSVSNEDSDYADNYVISNKEVYVDEKDTAFVIKDDGTVSYTFDIPAQANGKVSFTAYDYSGNPVADKPENIDDNNIVIADKINPKVSVEYIGELKENYNSKYIYSGSVTAKIKVNETYFYEDNVEISATKDGEETKDFQQEWIGADEDGNNVCNVTFKDDGDYTLIINYPDPSGNYMNISDKLTSENKQTSDSNRYESKVFTIDQTRPVVKVTYDVSTDNNIYTSDRTATITVTEKNFRPDEIETFITAKDLNGNSVGYTVPDLKSWDSWKKSENDTWVASIKYDTEAIYKFSISYKDIAQNPAKYGDGDSYGNDLFSVVKSVPKDLKVVSISNNYKNTWNKILNAVTFGYYAYKNDEVTITVQASHLVSPVNGFTWEYNREAEASTSNIETLRGSISADKITYSDNGTVATASFTLSAGSINYSQIRGNLKFTAYNTAGLSEGYTDNNDIVIIDTIAPERTVTFSPAKQTADSVLYYDDTASVRFDITEANFYPEDVNVLVNDQIRSLSWNKAEGQDAWYADMNISGDGDYVVKMTYTDRSDNVMKEYVSDKIVIDTVNPALNVAYTNKDVINDIDGNKIYNSNQTAVITINEHNFRASDIDINMTAEDINGNTIDIPDYSSYLKNPANWTNEGDVHTARITFSTEANYSLNIVYTDMAKRTTGDYSTDYFTVDKSNPYDISVSYSTSVLDTVLQAITFGFYNAPVNVTVEAKDDISAINRIEYDYNRDGSASGVNEELLAATIGNSDLTQSGNTATVQFSIPQNQLSQINGTMHLVAYDNAENNSDYSDDRRIVVDNIAPNATVTYNDPVQSYNGIAYYAGDIEATITVNEANFYPEDMIINVSDDGNNYPVNTQWSDVNADTHVGTFTISGDGDYYVSVSYTDKSQNVMDTYTSDQMTIDTQTPSISISNIKNNSANKDSKYTFTITANDTNFDISSFTPVLTAVIRDASGNYSVREISLGTVAELEAGKTYSFTVDNLDEDAVYTLTCIIKDLAGNEYSKILLDDGQEYESVVFSINRNGSTFSIDDSTKTLVNNYYVYEVSRDVVVYETNVDPINNYRIKLNGNELTENTDYTTTMSNNAGEWAIRTYNINKALFTDEGEYKIVVESTDKAETLAYSDVKNLNISFVVDKTAPILTVSGLENSGRYQSTEQEVTVLATDDGGRLNSFKAEVLDSSDQPISGDSVRFDKSGDELIQYLSDNDGKVTFTVPEGLSQKVVLTCSDSAVHEDGSTNETVQQFTKITVSPSGLIMFYANKPLFYGSIIFAVLILAGVTFIIVRKVQKSKAE